MFRTQFEPRFGPMAIERHRIEDQYSKHSVARVRQVSVGNLPRGWAASSSLRYSSSERRCRRQVVEADSSRSMRCSPWLASESLR